MDDASDGGGGGGDKSWTVAMTRSMRAHRSTADHSRPTGVSALNSPSDTTGFVDTLRDGVAKLTDATDEGGVLLLPLPPPPVPVPMFVS
jgi:hypothetical protein